jgi:hypothetical protein
MREVVISRCPVCPNIKAHTDQVVAELRNDPDLRIDVVDGTTGEFTVRADGQTVARKTGDTLPTPAEVDEAVHNETGVAV